MGLTKNLGWLSKYITADSTGKIGIGTASPNYGLNVVNSDLTLSGIVSNRFIGLRKENNTLPGYLGLLGGDNGDSALIIGYNSAGTQTLQISASTSPTYFNGGNVGIGVPSPTERLEIAGLVGNIRIYGRSGIAQNQISSNVYYNGSAWVRDTSSGAIAIGLDSNSGVLTFHTTAATSGFPEERMRINSGGSMEMQNGMIWLKGLTGNNANINGVGLWGGDNGGGIYARGTNGAKSFDIGNTQGNIFLATSGNVLIGKTTDGGAKFQVNGTVYASGRLSLGDGIVGNFNAINIASGIYTNTAAISIGVSNPTGGVVSPIITFNAPNDGYSYAVRGGMYYNGSNLQMEFRTTSDYRVKEDLIEDFNAIDLLDKIKIYDHKWIGASGRSYSVIAHELQNVIPYLVSGQKDAILEDGGMDLQTVDYSKLVPILIKGIQELTERIKTLENK